MRVLHVYRTYFPDPPGGLQEAIRQIALASARHGIESRVFALSPTPEPENLVWDGMTVLRARSWAAPASCDLGGLGAFRRFACAADWADVIHYHYPWPFADVLELMVRSNKPKVMTYHSDVVRQRVIKPLYGPMMHRMLGAMSAIVATSPAYAASSPVLSMPRYKGRIRVIPLGIDETTYGPPTETGVLARLGLAEGEPFFLFIGVLRYYKGLGDLIDAASNVQARIVIAGSGPEMPELQNRMRQRGLGSIILAGQVSDAEKMQLLSQCYGLVLPSHLRSEAFGMVLLEASMHGKPMVSCEIGTGTSFANLHNHSGFVVPPQSPQALAKAMNSLLADRGLAQQFGQVARRRYETLFSGPALGREYARLYQEILEK